MVRMSEDHGRMVYDEMIRTAKDMGLHFELEMEEFG